MNTLSVQVLLVSLFALGFGVTTYKGQALARGWPVGAMFFRDGSWINVLGFVSWISASAMAFRWLHWSSALVTVVAGVAGAFLLTNIFRSFFQLISLLLIPLFIAAWWFLGLL